MEREVKVVILGEGRVGKTSLLLKFVRDHFDDREESTVNANFLQKSVDVDGTSISLNIWDTAGQERFRAIAPIYYQQAKGAVVVYDITEQSSFDRVMQWVNELRKFAEPDINILIAGNKEDLKSRRKVNAQDAIEYCRSVNCKHFETSAKTGKGVAELFSNLARLIFPRLGRTPSVQVRTSKRIMLEKVAKTKESKPKKKCC
mmetsp:Transcript_24128/g.42833  ORF Transcript_24128/g.42833 Transcript_24128/m.42833 type:complete len:202 (-) Transcript_24128:3096-3701(-)